MANAAVGFGSALIVLGVAGYVFTGMQSPTALIPAVIGLLLLVAGLLARNPDRRKMWMHIAAVVGVIGFLGSAPGLFKLFPLLAGEPVERPNAVITQAIMAILTLVFVILCIRSFVNARRTLDAAKGRTTR
jgi:hypothetical protein